MRNVRVGLIGFGAWVRSAYLPALQYDGRADIVAVTAASEKTRRFAGEMLGENAAVFESCAELLAGADLDAVLIAVPGPAHAQVLTTVLESGVPAFYEPPLAGTRAEISLMMDRLLNARQVTCAHLELCYHPGVARAVQLINEHAIGLLQNVTLTLRADWGASPDTDICLPASMAGWYVSVLNQITQSVPSRALVLDGHGSPGRMQTVSAGILDYNGVWGTVSANVLSPEGLSLTADIWGSEGDVRLDFFSGELRRRSLAHPGWIIEDCAPLKPYAVWPGVREAVSAFLDAITSGTPVYGSARNTALLHKIGLALDESKDTGTWAAVPGV